MQSVAGQLRILGQRLQVEAVLQAPEISPAVKLQLKSVPEILRFASDQLMLPDNGSYRTYVALEHPFVAWNLFAAPELSLEGLRWCYPVAGCLGYRGYFSAATARAEAARLQASGHDVYVGGVAAYSTLGWFKDPILSSMLRADRQDLAALLFHELAHQKLWLPDDMELNEAFAEAVARIGIEKLAQTWGDVDVAKFELRAQEEDEFYALVLRHKEKLAALYASGNPDWRKRALKEEQFAALRTEYRVLNVNSSTPNRFTVWLETDLNNAKLLAVSAYRKLVPSLLELYHGRGQRLELLYTLVGQLQGCPLKVRHAWVLSGGTLPDCWSQE